MSDILSDIFDGGSHHSHHSFHDDHFDHHSHHSFDHHSHHSYDHHSDHGYDLASDLESLASDIMDAQCYAAFDQYDYDHCGRMEVQHFPQFLAAQGYYYTDTDASSLLRTVDLNNDGYISRDEAAMIMRAQSIAGINEAEMRQAFQVFDRSGDKRLSHGELMDMLMNYGDQRYSPPDAAAAVNEMMALFDSNRDGFLQYDEFVRAMFHGRHRARRR